MKLPRRQFLLLAAGAVTLGTSRVGWTQSSATTSQHVRVATGLLATWQSIAWLGAEAGLFKKRGIDMTLPAIAVGGPQAALREFLAPKYPAAMSLKETDIADTSFIDELERTGVIDQLYG